MSKQMDAQRLEQIKKRMAWADVLPLRDAKFLLTQLDAAIQTLAELHDSLKVVGSQRDTLRDILATQYNHEIYYDDLRMGEYARSFEDGDSE